MYIFHLHIIYIFLQLRSKYNGTERREDEENLRTNTQYKLTRKKQVRFMYIFHFHIIYIFLQLRSKYNGIERREEEENH